jgi:hypothetical protein
MRKRTRKVVDAAVAFGFRNNAEDFLRTKDLAVEKLLQAGDIIWARHRNFID